MNLIKSVFHNRSLGYKFTLISILPIIAVIFFIALFALDSFERSIIEETRRETLEHTDLIALSISNPFIVYNKSLLDGFIDNLSQDRNIIQAMIVDADEDIILAHSDHTRDGLVLDYSRMGIKHNRQKISYVPLKNILADSPEWMSTSIVIDGKKYADLWFQFSTKDVRREISLLKSKIMFFSVLAICLGVLLSIFLSRMISRPIKAMASQAERIGRGDFNQRIEYQSGDAMGMLANSFNRMVGDLKNKQEQLEAIYTIADRLYRSLDYNVVIEQAIEAMMYYSHSPSVAIFGFDQERGELELLNASGFGTETMQISKKLPIEGSLTGIAVLGKKVVNSEDILEDASVIGDVRDALVKDGLKSVVSVPLLFEDQVLGAMNLIFKEYHVVTEDERDTLLSIGKAIGLAITNAKYVLQIRTEIDFRKKTEEALRLRVTEITSLNYFFRNLGSKLSLRQVIKAAIDGLTEPIGPDLAVLYLLKENRLVLEGWGGTPYVESGQETCLLSRGKRLCELASQTASPVYSINIDRDPRCSGLGGQNNGLVSFAALPLSSGKKNIGVLGLATMDERDFKEEATFLETMAGQVAIALDNALLYDQVQKHAADLEKKVVERTAALETAMLKAQEADHLKSAFLASMSHELRTPLNSIIGFTGIILQGLAGPLNDEQEKQMKMVLGSARHLLSLINDVLDISKIEAGQLELSSDRFDYREIVEQVVHGLKPLADKKGLYLRAQVAPEVGSMVSDRRRVEQILINLVNNAIKFTETGGVEIDCGLEEEKIVTSIRDTGIGLAASDLEKLFQAFRQIQTGLTRKYEGTGLGLSICKKLAQLLKGKVWVESEGRGLGSTFFLALPLGQGVDNEKQDIDH